MGWFWGDWGAKPPEKAKTDPLSKLDPELRDFLRRESRAKADSQILPSATQGEQPAYTEKSWGKAIEKVEESSFQQENAVPPESLYQDGRYAHLWKNYQPLGAVEATSKSDQDKLSDILEGYNTRKAHIGRAALENCALEHSAVSECFRNGGWGSRLTMCRAENKKLERCYVMQARFLKALGYLSNYDRPEEVDEQIQMHADTLYQRMLEQEAAVEAAKSAGTNPPEYPPLVDSPYMGSPASAQNKMLTPSQRSQLRHRFKGLNKQESELEEIAILAEMEEAANTGRQVSEIYQEEERLRKERLAEGKETLSDRAKRYFRS